MNDITLEWRYNSVNILCRIIRKDEDKSMMMSMNAMRRKMGERMIRFM